MNSLSSIHRNIVASSMTYYNINNSNLIRYYPFDTDLNDYRTGSAVSNVTTIGGAAIVSGTTKLSSGSLYLNNASSQAIQIPSMTIAAGGFSMACWIKFMTGNQYSRIFDFGTGSGANIVCIYQNTTGSTLQIGFYITNPSSGTGGIYNTTYSLPDTNWHHLCATISSAGLWILYIDGTPYSTTTSPTAYPSTATLTNCYIGKSNETTNPYPTMYLNQVLLFNRVLTGIEIYNIASYPKQLSFTSSASSGPVSYTVTGTNTYDNTFNGGIWTLRLLSGSGTITFNRSFTTTILLVGGGGSGGWDSAGGGGSGGVLQLTSQTITTSAISWSVGAGGAALTAYAIGNNGGNTTFGANTVVGGGGGGSAHLATAAGNGGSGGGRGGSNPPTTSGTFGTGTAGQGNNGGDATANAGGGGGGPGGVGGTASGDNPGAGGGGYISTITGVSAVYGGGGGGGVWIGNSTTGTGGGNGGNGGNQTNKNGTNATGFGGGGGGIGNGSATASGSGFAGVIIIQLSF